MANIDIKEWQIGDNTYKFKDEEARQQLATKQDALTIDSAPTNGSNNLVKSGGVYAALATKANQSTTYTKTEVNNLIVPANTTIQVVEELPESGSSNTIYRLQGTNSYSDYGWDGTQFVKLAEYNGTNLYSTTGQNTDGAMSQKGVTDALKDGMKSKQQSETSNVPVYNDGTTNEFYVRVSDGTFQSDPNHRSIEIPLTYDIKSISYYASKYNLLNGGYAFLDDDNNVISGGKTTENGTITINTVEPISNGATKFRCSHQTSDETISVTIVKEPYYWPIAYDTTGFKEDGWMTQKAVTDEVTKLTATHCDSESELQIGDGGGNVVISFQKGHILTKYFSSKEICKQESLAESDLDIGDSEGNVILRINKGHIQTKNFSSEGFAKRNITGKHVIIERFGGNGNDWSFVRTPTNYNTSSKPFPWVILNHGNGWEMDGSEEKANFSSKTQFGVDTQNNGAYLDATRSDYVEYSSPLIETLLDAGYVVCGCQNYGDGLYGNNNCRNAIADFFDYMMANYNVSVRCHMIGASNGCLASLNACHLLGAGKVSSIALLYPLCDLFDHYLHYPAHRAGILSAYGLSGHTYSTLADLKGEKEFFTHCPVHHYIFGDDTNDEQVKTLAFPPMLIIASGGDSVVNINYNALKLKGLCDRSSLVCDFTDIDPNGVNGYGHGDWHHFKDSKIVDFFNVNK